MASSIAEISLSRAAKIAGIGYLVIIAAGIFAEFGIRSRLIIQGDAASTVNNILNSRWLFRLSIGSDLVMLICDIIVAWALYVFLKPVSSGYSLLAALFRLVHTAVYGVALLTLLFILLLLNGAAYLNVFEPEQLQALVLLLANVHSLGYIIALVFFALHVFIIGYLIFKSGYMPRTLGILLLLASLGYAVDSFANILLASYADYELIFALAVFLPAFISELSFALWLLIKGSKIPQAESPGKQYLAAKA